jgi:hypothetical protein
MDELEKKTLQVAHAIIQVIELAYEQRQTITWRTVFEFLKYPPEYYEDDPEIDDAIQITSDADLAILKAMITSKFAFKNNK